METDKIKLNDQIVLLRKCVKVAKVHTVRRLFRQMKMLRQKKGRKEEDTKKNQRKAERLKEEIAIITKSNPDNISKMALKEEKDWKKIIFQKDISTEERSFARLISHKKIHEKILQFRNANPDWQSWLPSTLECWERKKLTKFERMNSAVKDTSMNRKEKQNTANRLEISNAKKQENQTETEKPSVSIRKKHPNKEESSSDNQIKENKNIVQNKMKSKKGKLDKHKLKKNEKLRTEVNEYENSISKFLMQPKSEVMDRVEGNMEITEIHLDKLEDQESIPVHWISHVDTNVSLDNNAKPKKKLRDAFFLGTNDTASDQESCTESEHSISDEEQSSDKPKTQFISSLSGENGNDFSQLRKRINPKFFSKQDKSRRIPNTREWNKGAKRQFGEMSHRKRKFASPTENHHYSSNHKSESTADIRNSKLHPSWEAKKKLKQTTILPFQGKKIQFDIND